MPELPEVEVVAQQLRQKLVGQLIREVRVNRPRVIRPSTPGNLSKALRGREIRSVTRRAKFLLFELHGKAAQPRVLLIGHLGMTGRMYVQSAEDTLPKHAAVVVELSRGVWVFEDPRGFGRFHLDGTVLENLGPEPLESKFSNAVFCDSLKASRQAIKVRLLDQAVLAGVGNIYASEALYRSQISPLRESRSLNRSEADRLLGAIRAVFSEAIQAGISVADSDSTDSGGESLFYRDTKAISNQAKDHRFQVYDRAGLPCIRCGGAISRRVQAGRSTYACFVCQK